MATYTVYVARFKTLPTFQEAIYIETERGRGWTYQILGGQTPGWTYESKQRDGLEDSKDFYKKYLRGTVTQADLHKVDEICRTVPMPRAEMIGGIPFHRDCRHWVINALEKLQQQGIYKPTG